MKTEVEEIIKALQEAVGSDGKINYSEAFERRIIKLLSSHQQTETIVLFEKKN